MCADKFRKTAPLNITFSDGEQPTAAKLTAVANQGRNGLGLLEYPIGDPWNQNGDEYLVGTPLQIPNLARLLGENSYLNPVIYPGKDTFKFHDKVGERYENQTTGYLKFVPSGGTVTQQAGSAFGTQETNEYDVTSTGKFWVDSETGRFRTYDNISSGEIVYYSVDPSGWTVGTETLPGVIPDSRQATFTACRIKRNSSTSYSLYLPPRQPLTLTSRETPDRYPSAAEVALNALDTTITSPPSYWQDDSGSTDALFDPHYRYRLPKDILDVIASKSAGSELPAGMFYLWDQSTETIIDGVVFKRSNASTNETPTAGDDSYSYEYIIDMDVSDSTFDFDAIDTTGETEANYSGTGISLITCGSPLARNIWTILTSFMQHSHNNNGTLEGQVSHNDLLDLNPPDVNYTGNGHDSRYPTGLPVWPPSNWEYDPHTSLLSRGGSPDSGSVDRDIYKNAMLGNLLIANSDSADYLDAACDDSSFKIYFGDTNGTSLYVDATNGLTATAAGGANFVGLRAESAGTGHALEAIANDTTKGIYTNGRVGIGATSPRALLDIDSSTTHAGIAIDATSGNSYIDFYVGGVAKANIYWYNTGNYFYINSYGTDTCLNVAGGNVGIGTDSPDTKLHIYTSDTSASAHGNYNDLIVENNSACGISVLSKNDSVGGVAFADSGNSIAGLLYYDHNDNSMNMATDGTNRWTIDSAGDLTAAGTYQILAASAAAGAGAPAYSFTGDVHTGMFQAAGDEIGWSLGGSEAMRLDGTGLGIGTDSPGQKLHIHDGNVLFSDWNSTNTLYLETHADNQTDAEFHIRKAKGGAETPTACTLANDNLGTIRFQGYDGSSWITGAAIRTRLTGVPSTNNMPTRLEFYTNSGAASETEKMRIDPDGNVGIGVTSPTRKLEVVATTTTAIYGVSDGDHAIYGFVDNSGSGVASVGGIYGANDHANGYGVWGNSSAGIGVRGISSGSGTYGIFGTNNHSGGYGVKGSSTNGTGILAESGAGTGLSASSGGSYGAVIQSQTTNKSSLRLIPQATDPATSPAAGDIYVNSTTGQLSQHNGTTWNPLVSFIGSQSGTDAVNSGGGVVTLATLYTFPADSLAVGQCIRVNLHASLTKGSSTASVSVQLGGTVIDSYNVANSRSVFFDIEFIVTAIGGSGTTDGRSVVISPRTADDHMDINVISTAIDTTGSLALTVDSNAASGTPDSSVTLRYAKVDIS